MIHPVHRNLSAKLITKLKLVSEVLELMWQSDKECLLFEGVTNFKYTRLSHKSQIKGQIKRGMIYPPKPQGLVMAHTSCNLFCGISFMSFGVIQRQNLLEFMTYSLKFNSNLNFEPRHEKTCLQRRAKQVFHVRADISATILAI